MKQKQLSFDPIPYGYCHCGCGRKTTISPTNRRAYGYIKGEPRPYVIGHSKFSRGGPEAPLGMKWCFKCKEIKDLSEFYKSSRNANGVQGVCKDCQRILSKEWKAKNGERNRFYGLKSRLKTKFGMTLEEYEQMLEAQDHKCAICRSPETATRKKTKRMMCIDHDHKTGKVRGLLCNDCNRALGLIKEEKQWLQNAINYLAKYPDS